VCGGQILGNAALSIQNRVNRVSGARLGTSGGAGPSILKNAERFFSADMLSASSKKRRMSAFGKA